MHAHKTVHVQELDAPVGSCGCAITFLEETFLEGVAARATTILCSFNINGVQLQAHMVEAERMFSCQVSVQTTSGHIFKHIFGAS
jgi:sRNA-binding regulator protein Hfq